MKKIAYLVAVAALGMGTAAQAQTSGSATADVTVTLEAPASVNVSKQSDIAFGSIELPETGACGVRMNTGNDGFPGVLVHTSIPTLAQCVSTGGTTSAGKIAVTCTPGVAINFVATAENGTVPGVTIANGGQTIQPGGDGGAVAAKGSDYTTVCHGNGKMNVGFTTEMYIAEGTAAGTDLTVGTVTMTATIG